MMMDVEIFATTEDHNYNTITYTLNADGKAEFELDSVEGSKLVFKTAPDFEIGDLYKETIIIIDKAGSPTEYFVTIRLE